MSQPVCRVVLTLILTMSAWCSPALGQGKVQLLFSHDADIARATERFEMLALRPNVEMPFHVFLKNDGLDDEDLQFTLACQSQSQTSVLQQREVKLKGKSWEPIVLKLDKPLSVKEAQALIFTLLDRADKNRQILQKTVKLKIMMPDEYLEFASELDNTGQLLVKIKRSNGFKGPPCRLELDCSSLRNLIPGQEYTGSLVDTINAADKADAVLALQQLKFRKNASDFGYLSITVDGIPRARMFVTDMVPGKVLKTMTDVNIIRLNAPRYHKPEANKPFAVRIEVDNLEVDQASIKLVFDRTGTGLGETYRLSTTRNEELVFSSSEKGILTLKPVVQDWVREFSTEGLNGVRKFTAELLGRDNAPLSDKPTSLSVVFSKDPPKNTRISLSENKPMYQLGEKVLATATAESLTGITKASFFLGETAPKEPEKMIAGAETETGWQASITLPDQKGRAKLGVIMENNIGLSSTYVMDVMMEDPAMSANKEKLATLKGNVVQGERNQRGLTVELFDDKKTLVKSATTDDNGNFTFTDLQAGSYLVVCVRSDNAQDRKVVSLAKGAEATVRLSLVR